MFEEEYRLEYFKAHGYQRRICKHCNTAFWTLDPDRQDCGGAPCVDYAFIGNPVIKKKHTITTMRESFLDFHEKHGHTRLKRFPVMAKWRSDIYLTIASIADFQPHVTSGDVPPPANPLVISQPCIRLSDLDSIGRSGRHLSTFEMMGHHAFNYPDKKIYWKEETVKLCTDFYHQVHGIPAEAIVYREDPWVGGGNAGPALEVMCQGLEVATLVFMCMKATPNGKYEIKGDKYDFMDMNIVDTGYGNERSVWISHGTPNIYDAIYPEITSMLFERKDMVSVMDKNRKLLTDYAKICGVMDFDGAKTLKDFRQDLTTRLTKIGHDVTPKKLGELMTPIENIYAVTDHAKCLAFMLGDGIVPSNAKAGYLARLVIRRAIRMIEELGLDMTLGDIVDEHIKRLPEYPELAQSKDIIHKVLDLETERYKNTMDKGRRLIESYVKTSKSGIDQDKLVEFYDRHGIHPSIVAKVASEMNVAVTVPDNFSTLLANLHSKAGKDEVEEEGHKERKFDLPDTKLLFYANPNAKEFDSTVLYCKDKMLVLAESAFYPEGGGQNCDLGYIVTPKETIKVTDVQKYDKVVVHVVEKDVKVGEMVKGVIDWERRLAHQRHHSATHIILGSARKVLGEHVWQAGAKKTDEFARLDITHYERVTEAELKEIERVANDTVLAMIPLERSWMDREEAERRYGFRLYEGGIPPGKKLRIVRMGDFDVEACAGTHVNNTGEIGFIKIINAERIADGVERLEFAAGKAALRYIQKREDLMSETCAVFSVRPEQLPKTATRFFQEWKEQKKEIENLRKSGPGSADQEARMVGDVKIVAVRNDLNMPDLVALAQGIIKNPKTIAVVIGQAKGTSLLIARSADLTVHCGDVLKAVGAKVGMKGGGKPDFAQGGGPPELDATKVKTATFDELQAALAK